MRALDPKSAPIYDQVRASFRSSALALGPRALYIATLL
jgi:hypothetical protein